MSKTNLLIPVPRKRKNKKGSLEKSIFKILLWTVAIILVAFYTIEYFTRPPDIFYPGFEIEIPSGYEIHGIDVSRYQSLINWESVAGMESRNVRIGFAFIKATEGINRIDPQYRRNWMESEKHNVTKGAYHFFIASRSGKRQASNFTQLVELKKGDLPPVVDIEKTFGASKNTIQSELQAWLLDVENFYKVKPIIYTNIDFYERYLEDKFSEYPLWIAHYLQPEKPRIAHEWYFWQHSEQGRVNGIMAPVDFNVFSGDSSDFNALKLQKD